jgi:hypothetical protein
MKRRTTFGLAAAGVTASAALGLLGLASAQTGPETASANPLPKGPYVDFCPSAEQAEAHQKKYGFDYKPTVPCTREGGLPPQAPSAGAEPSDPESDKAAKAREKAFLRSLRRTPDTDGDPATIESVDPDGREVVIIIQTSEPELFKGMTPAEFAEKAHP